MSVVRLPRTLDRHRRALAVAGVLATTALAALLSPASGLPAPRRTQTLLEDTVGFPKIAIFRPGSVGTGRVLARYDWVIVDGNGDGVEAAAAAERANPRLLTMIVPFGGTRDHDVIAATYGYSKIAAPISSPWGTLRPKQTEDDVLDPNGAPHQYGDVTVLNMQHYESRSATAIWSAEVRAKYYLDDVRGHAGIKGIWGDNDFWSDQGYAWEGTEVDRRAWDDGFIAAHRALHDLLPSGTIIGGNDISSMAAHPGKYRGNVPGGWKLLHGLGQAGMKESANRYYGLTDPAGLDDLITGIRRFLGLKRLDGLQRYEMLNVSGVEPTSPTARLALAAACISGGYLWGYAGGSGDFPSAVSFWMPEFDLHGRHWLGLPLANPVKVSSGVWIRRFEHGTVVANASGADRTVDGIHVAAGDGAFAAVENGTAPRAKAAKAKPKARSKPKAKAAHAKPRARSASFHVRTYSLKRGQRLRGRVLWRAVVSGGRARTVDFAVDGRHAWVERYPPYVFNGTGGRLDTTAMPNGRHTLTVVAHRSGGGVARSTIAVVVDNPHG